MYSIIKDSLNATIDKCREMEVEDETRDRDKHYFIEGLRVSLQLIDQAEELSVGELAFETLEETLVALKDGLDVEDVKELVTTVFREED